MKLVSQESYEEAFRQVLAHRTQIMASVKMVIHHPQLAEDTFSEVTLEIVRSWDRYDDSRPFGPWARGVARRVALSQLRKHNKQATLLDEEILELIHQEMEGYDNESLFEQYKDQLNQCLGKLSEKGRRLIRMRYFENRSYQEMADAEDKTANALYVAFTRIHQSLFRCLKKLPPSI